MTAPTANPSPMTWCQGCADRCQVIPLAELLADQLRLPCDHCGVRGPEGFPHALVRPRIFDDGITRTVVFLLDRCLEAVR